MPDNQDRIELFNHWARRYDLSVRDDVGYPFAGYEQVLETAVKLADVRPKMKVLDVGAGTGNLTRLFVVAGCLVWGTDFSGEMLGKAREKLLEAEFIQVDILGDWPEALPARFDRIVSTYVLHEFDFKTKAELLVRLAGRLEEGGSIVVGDIAFPSVEIREQAAARWADIWDEDEFYWAADETAQACKGVGIEMSYKQISVCGGVFVFRAGN